MTDNLRHMQNVINELREKRANDNRIIKDLQSRLDLLEGQLAKSEKVKGIYEKALKRIKDRDIMEWVSQGDAEDALKLAGEGSET